MNIHSALFAYVRPYVETHGIGGLWIGLVIVTAAIEIGGGFRRRADASEKDAGSMNVLRLCFIPSAAILVLAPHIAPGAGIGDPPVTTVVGIVIFVLGEAMRIWSKIALGKYFTYTVMTSADQAVITTGPYKVLRHPSYTGILLLAFGIGVVLGNWVGFGAMAIGAMIGLSYRIRIEERALTEELGDRYRDYAQHHKRLIPFIW